jgi:shikimate kinase
MSSKRGKKIAITGFMGVGKSSVGRHLASLLECEREDLDQLIEAREQRRVTEIIGGDGEPAYRRMETETLRETIARGRSDIISLGGGTWTIAENRRLIIDAGFTVVWLESSFEHCWMNIKHSRKERPLARNKSDAKRLFDDRQKYYCLADWHFVVKPEFTSYDVARRIYEEFFS